MRSFICSVALFLSVSFSVSSSLGQGPIDVPVVPDCFAKTTIDCTDLEWQILDKSCADKACRFIETVEVQDCAVYDGNGGYAVGTYVCEGKKELIRNPVVKKECKNAANEGYQQLSGTANWYCIRERYCASSCTQSSATVDSARSVNCYFYDVDGERNVDSRMVMEKKAVCDSLPGSGAKPGAMVTSFVNYIECGGVCP